MDELVIQSHRGPYRVRFDRPFAGLEQGLTPREHLLIDETVARLYAQPLRRALAGHSVLAIEAMETNKSLEAFPRYALHLIEHGIQRGHTLVAVGGGIVQDIAAFLAATLLRGLPWRFYPTTLLAQADSCIGSKSSVNVGGYKNQLGAFTPPSEIVIAAEVLDTLDERDIRSGIGEMIKAHIISGPDDARTIAQDYPRLAGDRDALRRAIRRALEIKRIKVERDEFDQHERLIMNYGHTFGHAIESATDYAIPHGIAVTIGMDMANELSCRLGLCPRGEVDALRPMLLANAAGFESVSIPEARFVAALRKDKKRVDGDLSLILLRGPGQVFRDRYPFDEALQGFCRDYLRALPAQPSGVPCPA